MEDDEAIKFLERDFNQCFVQMRHYDSQIWNICRFSFTAYIAILGTAIGMYQYSAENNIDLIPAAMGVLGAGLALGLLLYSLAVCNRGLLRAGVSLHQRAPKAVSRNQAARVREYLRHVYEPSNAALFQLAELAIVAFLHDRVAQLAIGLATDPLRPGRVFVALGIDRNIRDNRRPTPDRAGHRLPEISRG